MNFGILPMAEFDIDPTGVLAGIEFATVNQLYGEIKNRFKGPVLLLIGGERTPDRKCQDTVRFDCQPSVAGAFIGRMALDWAESEE